MNKILKGYQVCLRSVTKADLEQLRQWRNDPWVKQFMLTQQNISAEQQLAWFHKIKADMTQHHFVIEYKQQPIGSANIRSRGINVPLTEARIIEPGLYIGEPKYRQNILAFAPTLLLNDYCFQELNAEKLVAVVKPDNQAALHYNEKLGYKVDRQDELIHISLTESSYQASTTAIKALLSR